MSKKNKPLKKQRLFEVVRRTAKGKAGKSIGIVRARGFKQAVEKLGKVKPLPPKVKVFRVIVTKKKPKKKKKLLTKN